MERGTHEYAEDKRNENILIYVNGDIVPRNDAKISVFDSGFLVGDGVWEGMRLHRGRLAFIDLHLDRLFANASDVDLRTYWLPNEIVNAGFTWDFNAPELGGHFNSAIGSITDTVKVPAGTENYYFQVINFL